MDRGLIVALLVLLVLAGCSTTTSDPETSTPTTRRDSAGLTLPGTITESALNMTHVRSLRAAQSVTVKTHRKTMLNRSGTVRSSSVVKTIRVDLPDDQYLKVSSSTAWAETRKFTNATATYKKTGNNTPRKSGGRVQFDSVNVTHALVFAQMDSSVHGMTLTYEKVGTTTFNGTPVAEYHLTPASMQAFQQAFKNQTGQQDVRVTHSTVVVYIDANQTVRYFNINVTLTSDTMTYRYSETTIWSAIGETDVNTPEWVETAEQQSTT